jgi:hypothetical protein
MSRANPRFRRPNTLLPVPTGNVWRARFFATLESQVCMNTFWYMDGASPGTGSLTIANSLITGLQVTGGLQSKFLAAMSADCVLTAIEVDSPNNPSLIAALAQPLAVGTGVAGHEPTYVGAVLNRQTAIKGQCGRGHITTIGVPTAWVTSSSLTTTTAHAALATQMMAVITQGANTFTPALFSRGTRVSHVAGCALLTGVFLRLLLGTVRRRKVGRGK